MVFTLQMWAMNILIGVIARVKLGPSTDFTYFYVTCGQRRGLNHPQHKIHNQSVPVTESESSPQLNTISHLFVAIGATGT